MRIGFFTTRMVLGYGVDLTVHELALRLAQRGHRVDVWTPTSDGTYADEPYALREIIVEGSRWNRALPLLERHAQAALKQLRERLAAEGTRYDVVVPCTHPYYYAGPLLGSPQVFFNFGNVPTDGFSWKGKLNWAWLDLSEQLWFKPQSDRVVSISDFLHNQQALEIRRKGEVVHLGGDHYAPPADPAAAAALRADFRARHGIPADAVVVGYCGRLHKDHPKYKGLGEVLDIGARIRALHPGVVLALAGIGSPVDGAWLSGQGAHPLLNLPPAEMPGYYSALDVYVTASRWEGFDLPIVEAAHHGVPAVAYNVGAHGEHTTAVLVHELEPGELGRAVLTLVRDSPLRRRLGAQARQVAQRFTWDRAAAEFAEVLAEVAR